MSTTRVNRVATVQALESVLAQVGSSKVGGHQPCVDLLRNLVESRGSIPHVEYECFARRVDRKVSEEIPLMPPPVLIAIATSLSPPKGHRGSKSPFELILRNLQDRCVHDPSVLKKFGGRGAAKIVRTLSSSASKIDERFFQNVVHNIEITPFSLAEIAPHIRNGDYFDVLMGRTHHHFRDEIAYASPLDIALLCRAASLAPTFILPESSKKLLTQLSEHIPRIANGCNEIDVCNILTAIAPSGNVLLSERTSSSSSSPLDRIPRQNAIAAVHALVPKIVQISNLTKFDARGVSACFSALGRLQIFDDQVAEAHKALCTKAGVLSTWKLLGIDHVSNILYDLTRLPVNYFHSLGDVGTTALNDVIHVATFLVRDKLFHDF